MNYRSYRLVRPKQERTAREVGKVQSRASKIEAAIGSKFSGSDPVRIFSSLRDIVQEANNNRLTEGQLFLAVPRLLTGHAKTHFETSRDGSRRGTESISSWPETVNFLLTAYATPRAITAALDDLRDMRQKRDETESAFSDRLNAAISRCGGVHSSEEKSTHFVEHLLPSLSPVVAQRREEKPEMTYYELVRYATMLGDAERARRTSRKELKATSSSKKKISSSKALVMDEEKKKKRKKKTSRSSSSTKTDSVGSSAGTLNIVASQDGSSADDESSSSSEVSSSDTEEGEALPMEPRYMPAAKVSFDNQRSRGWVDRGPPRGRSPSPGEGRARYPSPNGNRGAPPPALRPPGSSHAQPGEPREVLCHTCYGQNHYATACVLPATELTTIVVNYANLRPDQKSWVPRLSFDNAMAKLQAASQAVAANPTPSSPKN